MFLFSLYWVSEANIPYGGKAKSYSSQSATLKGNYNQPLLLGNFDTRGIEEMLIGLTVQATQKVDMLFTQSVSL